MCQNIKKMLKKSWVGSWFKELSERRIGSEFATQFPMAFQDASPKNGSRVSVLWLCNIQVFCHIFCLWTSHPGEVSPKNGGFFCGQKWVCLKMLCTPVNPMVLLIIIPIKWLFPWEYTLFSDKPKWAQLEDLSNLRRPKFRQNFISRIGQNRHQKIYEHQVSASKKRWRDLFIFVSSRSNCIGDSGEQQNNSLGKEMAAIWCIAMCFSISYYIILYHYYSLLICLTIDNYFTSSDPHHGIYRHILTF